jgi:ABC-type cobalamin/Fe3+-siderophores transport system ATPase subunit
VWYLTEKLPPNNLTVFELIALGRQPYTNWIGKQQTQWVNGYGIDSNQSLSSEKTL